MEATVAEAVVHAVDAVAAVDVVDTVDTVDAVHAVHAVEPETATKVSALIAKFTAILQMQAENTNTLRREETTMSAFASSAGSDAMSRLIASPTNV
jgi:ribosome-binding ATPase YchF (GTP1/OBG family)